MKAITLWEPWASLVVYGEKNWETRSWPIPKNLIGQRVAIHAAKRWDPTPTVQSIAYKLRNEGHLDFWHQNHIVGIVPPPWLGCVLGIVTLAECLSTKHCVDSWPSSDREFTFGDYSFGRFAWRLDDKISLPKPVPAVGRQRFWEWAPEVGQGLAKFITPSLSDSSYPKAVR